MVGSTRFVLAFVVFVCSMFVVISEEVSRCPSGTHESWIGGRCLYVKESNDKEATWRTDRDEAHGKTCSMNGIGGYDWKLPSFQFIGKRERLFEILQEHMCGRECSIDDFLRKMKKWHFWIRLVRLWEADVDEKPEDDEKPIDKTSKWTWGKGPKLSADLANRASGYPPWANGKPSEEFRPGTTNEDKTCVISKIKEDGKYPWFEWVAAPCKLKSGKLASGERERGTDG